MLLVQISKSPKGVLFHGKFQEKAAGLPASFPKAENAPCSNFQENKKSGIYPRKDDKTMQEHEISKDTANAQENETPSNATKLAIRSGGISDPLKVSVNGTDIRCYAVDYHVDASSVPTCVVGLWPQGDIEIDGASIQFSFTPQTVTDAVKILRHEILINQDLRKAFRASIRSALEEVADGDTAYSIAERVLRRIVGEE